MRKVVLYQLTTLDGVAEEPGDCFSDDGPELFENLGRVFSSQDLSNRGLRGVRPLPWPGSRVSPATLAGPRRTDG